MQIEVSMDLSWTKTWHMALVRLKRTITMSLFILCIFLLQPHFERVMRSPLTPSKMGLGSLSGLPTIQSVIVGVKTPCIEAFFISLKRS